MADSLAEMVKSLKPGVRVKRGRDWNYGDIDGNSEGTFTGTYTNHLNGWLFYKVKWDCTDFPIAGYRMDDGKYDLQIVDFALPPTDKPITQKLFLDKKFTDFKIKCQGKIYECHRCILGSQSNVFEAMLNMDMKEGASGEVEINDVTTETMDILLYYLYHEEVEDAKLVDTNLMFAAEKYNVPGLLKLCVKHLKASLSMDNVLDILLSAHLIPNQEDLFNTASIFVYENRGKLTKTMEWKEMMETNPKLIANVLSNVLGLQ